MDKNRALIFRSVRLWLQTLEFSALFLFPSQSVLGNRNRRPVDLGIMEEFMVVCEDLVVLACAYSESL
jgi:hypothetical protein